MSIRINIYSNIYIKDMLKGYNHMNTNVPNTFATDGKKVLSGAGRKKAVYEGSGWMDDITKG
jgi:hypothetical protein